MSLRDMVEADLALIVEDPLCSFGWPITLTDPGGAPFQFTGLSQDIAQVVDPDTGMLISGRLATVGLRMSSLYGAGIVTLPRGISNNAQKPWLVEFDDINGVSYKFKVAASDPDRTTGFIILHLESYV